MGILRIGSIRAPAHAPSEVQNRTRSSSYSSRVLWTIRTAHHIRMPQVCSKTGLTVSRRQRNVTDLETSSIALYRSKGTGPYLPITSRVSAKTRLQDQRVRSCTKRKGIKLSSSRRCLTRPKPSPPQSSETSPISRSRVAGRAASHRK